MDVTQKRGREGGDRERERTLVHEKGIILLMGAEGRKKRWEEKKIEKGNVIRVRASSRARAHSHSECNEKGKTTETVHV